MKTDYGTSRLKSHFKSLNGSNGPSIKYVTLEGEGVREDVTICDRGGGARACDVILLKFFLTYET